MNNGIIYFIDRDGYIHEGELSDFLENVELYEVESNGRIYTVSEIYDSYDAAEGAKK